VSLPPRLHQVVKVPQFRLQARINLSGIRIDKHPTPAHHRILYQLDGDTVAPLTAVLLNEVIHGGHILRVHVDPYFNFIRQKSGVLIPIDVFFEGLPARPS